MDVSNTWYRFVPLCAPPPKALSLKKATDLEGVPMPIVEITLVEGRPPERLRALITQVTAAVQTSIGVPIESIRVVLREVPPAHFAAGDVTIAERGSSAAHDEGPG